MKYKIMGVLVCSLALLFAFVAPIFEVPDTQNRVHQHLEAPPKKADAAKDKGFSTHLPLVEIDTDGKDIPGVRRTDADGNKYYTVAEDGKSYINARIKIIDHKDTYNHEQDAPTLQSDITIHVRGRSSRRFEKPNYDVRLITPNGDNNPQPVMGMDPHHQWAMHGPYLDKSLIRNYMWYNIGGEIMDYAPNVRFCEVLLNGKYQGVYVMEETLTAGDDGARLDLTVNAKNNTFSGYLLQYNSGYPTDRAVTNNFTAYTGFANGPMEIMYPGRRNLTPEMVEAISQDFSEFEKPLFSFDYDSDKYGYKAFVDMQSFVDYFLISELTCNMDAVRYSVYIGKTMDDRFKMYLWDMNSCCDNYQDWPVNRESFFMYGGLWYSMMMRDEEFVDMVIDRYWALRETHFDPDYLCNYIDETVAYLGPAVARNTARWQESYDNNMLLEPEGRDIKTHAEACAQMKDFLRERIAWMDDNIETLRQYAADSAVKQYNEVAT